MQEKRKPVFLRTEVKMIHGSPVEVKVFGEIDPSPSINSGGRTEDLTSATSSRVEQIKKEVDDYREKLLSVEMPDLSEYSSELEGEGEDWGTGEREEKFVGIDRVLAQMGLK